MKTITRLDPITAQGDLILIPVDVVPDGYTRSDDLVLAHSETGHHHVAVGDATSYRRADEMLLSYLVCRGPVEIEHRRPHDTHETLRLLWDAPDVGETIWEIRRQREYTPDGWRRVED